MSRQPSYKVIVVGGGLGGLGAAIALATKGHHVEVLEGASVLSEIGAGITIPPNASRILVSQYGLRDQFEKSVVWPPSINMRRYATGEIIGLTPLWPKMREDYGFPYWLIHRADYQLILYEAAIAAGVTVRLNSRVKEVDEMMPSVTLHDGEKLIADLVVGADGIRSRVRDTAVESEDIVEPRSSTNCAYRAMIPSAVMNADPILKPLMDSQYNCWIGYRRHVMAYPIRHGKMYNIVMSHPGRAAIGKWNESGDVAEMRHHYRDFDPVVQNFLSKIETCSKWKLADLPQLSKWVSRSGKVALIGDAAHGMLQYLGQGAAQAMEDGATLAECVARATDHSLIPDALRAFEKIRRRRCETIQKGSSRNAEIWHLPDGEEQQERDAAMNPNKPKSDSTNVKNPNQWSDPEFQPWLFGHDAVKHANERLDVLFDASNKDRANGDGLITASL